MTIPVTNPTETPTTKKSPSEEIVAKHKKYLWPSVTNYYQNTRWSPTAARCNTFGISTATSTSTSLAASLPSP